MRYISTRGGMPPITFEESVMMGLARDGGLLLPDSIPDVTAELDTWRSLSYVDLACRILALYTDLPEPDMCALVQRSYASFDTEEVTPLVQLDDLWILELFHGPTLAFKDVALQLLGNLFETILTSYGHDLNILAATSGDTGSAAIHGVRSKDHVRIFVMHPHGKISATQERQMTSVLDPNVFNLAIDGTFDDCQEIMKSLFSDLSFKDTRHLGSVNSINWARLLAQIVYYFYGAFRVMDHTGSDRVSFSVPTGNFGDIFAGYLAHRMGLPIHRLILATNENDILARFFSTGVYERSSVCPTLSPSMDIQVASNFERYLYYRTGEDPDHIGSLMESFAKTGRMEIPKNAHSVVDDMFRAGRCSNQETTEQIAACSSTHNYILDPHTAVGVHVAQRNSEEGVPTLCLATAHPAKFAHAIRTATGKTPTHPIIEALQDLPVRCDVLPADPDAVRRYLEEHIACGGRS